MTSRRDFLRHSLCTTAGLLSASSFVRVMGASANTRTANARPLEAFKGHEVFDRILAKALRNRWSSLPMGALMGRIARELEGTPYVAFTLELSPDREVCAVDLTGLDCVTFFEDTLAFARMLKKAARTSASQALTPQDLLREVTFTRYRGGQVAGFASRLHYTTDWFHDNERKGVVQILAPTLPGHANFEPKVGIMSQKPQNYRQLAAHPELIPAIRKTEAQINARPTSFIPAAALPRAEKYLRTGDIVGIATSIAGIDIAHTGLVIVDERGVPHFMDASSSKSKRKVTFEPGPLHRDLQRAHFTGAIFARPLEPKTTA